MTDLELKISEAVNTTPPLVDDALPLARLNDITARKITIANLRGGLFNAKDYGAVGDGAINDHSAIQHAIDAAIAAGGQPVLPPGEYKLGTNELNIDGSVGLAGAGPVESILTYTGSDAAVHVNAGGGVAANGWALRDLKVHCQDTGAFGVWYGQEDVSPKSANGMTSNVWVEGATVACFRMTAAQLCSWYQCWALNSVGHGYWFEASSLGSGNTTSDFYSCRSKSCKKGWYVEQGFGVNLYSCTNEVNTEEGVYINKTDALALGRTSLINCHFETNNDGRSGTGHADILIDCESALTDVYILNPFISGRGAGNYDIRINKGVVELQGMLMTSPTNSVYLANTSSARLKMSYSEDPSSVLVVGAAADVQAVQWGGFRAPYTLWVNDNGTLKKMIDLADGSTGAKLGLFSATPIAQPTLATGTGKTVDNVITVLQSLGLVKQS